MVQNFDSEDTLCYVFDDDEVLLIEKKRGHESDQYDAFYNGPGGTVESFETPEEGARREVEEETGLKPENLRKTGELEYYFPDSFCRLVHVYRTKDYSGTEKETEEAIPQWTETDQIPYENMWDNDSYWMPLMLNGIDFRGEFEFEDVEDELEISDWSLENASF